MPLLDVRNLGKTYYGFPALRDVSFAVEAGELVGVIGPNGAGKTTLFDCIMGALRVTAGQVRLRGEDITGEPEHAIALRGMRRMHQLTEVFPRLSVLDHLLIAAQESRGAGLLPTLFGTAAIRSEERHRRERARELLELLRLTSMRDAPGGTLSYGQRKLVALGMMMMAGPALVLLDEPMGGVNEALIEELVEHITALNRQGQTFLVIEHNMNVVMRLCRHVIVLDHGEMIAGGTPAEVRANPAVLEAYFGR
jgi:branched-chain amino acid transport system ATP-binding protein